MTEKHKSQTEDPEVAIQSAIGRVEGFIMNNGRSLLTALIVVVVVVGGFFGYKYLISGPRAEKAAAMMFVAEQQFAVDSFALALNGDGNFAGFLEVIDRYGSTDEGNLARHYAGICYLRLGEYQQALDYLKEYSASAQSSVLASRSIRMHRSESASVSPCGTSRKKRVQTSFPTTQRNVTE